LSMSTSQKPVCLNRLQLVVDGMAEAEVVGTMELISAAAESEANNRTAEIEVNVSPSMAGAQSSRSFGV